MKLSIIRKNILKYHVGVFMSITVLFFSCTKDDTIAKLSTPQVNGDLTSAVNTETLSDSDIFKGVMFLEGPLANKLSDFKEFNIRNFTSDKFKIQNVIDFQNKVIAKLKEGNQNYLKEFRAGIGSGDYYNVKSTLQKATDDIFNVSLILSGKNKTDINNSATVSVDNFKSKYNITSNSSKQEILDALKQSLDANSSNEINTRGQATGIQNINGPIPSVSVSVYISAYTVVVIAVAVMLIAVLGAAAGTKSQVYGATVSRENVNNYFYEHFVSEVTLKLSKI